MNIFNQSVAFSERIHSKIKKPTQHGDSLEPHVTYRYLLPRRLTPKQLDNCIASLGFLRRHKVFFESTVFEKSVKEGWS